jgi:RecB family exonuclease
MPEASETVGVVSPSFLNRLDCPARVAFDQEVKASGRKTSQSSSAALVGTVVHRAMEFVVGDNMSPDVAWDRACDESAAEASPGIGESSRYRRRFRRRATLLTKALEAMTHLRAPVLELTMLSKDRRVEGTADLVAVTSDGLVVVDYKSGVVSGEDGVKAEYKRQLQVYAALAVEHFDRPIAMAALASFKDPEVLTPVPASPEECNQAMAEARRVVDEFNARAPGPQPGVPAASHCRWCRHQAYCTDFWASVNTAWVEELGGHAVTGEISRVETASNGLSALLIRPVAGTVSNSEEVLVTKVPSTAIKDIHHGDVAACTGLWRRDEDSDLLTFGRSSRVAVESTP